MIDFSVGGRAAVRTAIAPMHQEARVSSPQASQQLAGHGVDVVAVQDDWLRVRGDDAYEGWVHRGYLIPAPAPTARGSRHETRISLGCVTRDRTGARRALPLGAYLSPEETLDEGEALTATELGARFPLSADAICRTALERFQGASYQWGGVTPWGADCSGLVQSVFGLHGVRLPRDAWQQAESGEPGAPSLGDARPAELLFFSDRDDRRITHVGIALGKRRMVHLALGRGGYAVERLDDAKDGYVVKLVERFVAARRVL